MFSSWLAEGELSTCSSSPRVLHHSLYLPHQFSFHALGEGHHALLQLYQLDIIGAKIEARSTIEIGSYTSGGDNAAFAEGFSSPCDVCRVLHRSTNDIRKHEVVFGHLWKNLKTSKTLRWYVFQETGIYSPRDKVIFERIFQR